MKHVKHLLIAVMSVFLAFVLVVPAFAAGSGSITVTPPAGTQEDSENTYTLYKVFSAIPDASGKHYSYHLSGTHTTVPDGFVLDDSGNIYMGEIVSAETATTIKIVVDEETVYLEPTTATELDEDTIAAIAAYVDDDDIAGTKTVTGMTPAEFTGLDDGYYYVTTTTGSLVIIDTTQPAVDIADKNTVPSVDKTITGATSMDADGKKALAQVGTTVSYSAEITIGDGAIGYIFHDKMEAGLTYNNDAKVYYDEEEVAATGHYTTETAAGDTFTITFLDDYIKTLEVGSKITVEYSATVNSAAITLDPLNNTCYVNYGDENGDNRTPESGADVYEAKFTVTKHDGDGEPLSGAGFVLKNAAGKYYKLTVTDGKPVVSWVDNVADADEHSSNAQGAVEPFTGLANGTYTLVENTVPASYNKAADYSFTIAEHDYTAGNLEQSTTVINNQGSELPSTGGMGTTILYTVGGCMIVAGIVMFLTKRRMASLEK